MEGKVASVCWECIVLNWSVVVKNAIIARTSWEEGIGELIQKVRNDSALEIIERNMIAESVLFTDTHAVAIYPSVSVCQMLVCSHVCIYFRGKPGPRNQLGTAHSAMHLFHLSVVLQR